MDIERAFVSLEQLLTEATSTDVTKPKQLSSLGRAIIIINFNVLSPTQWVGGKI